MIPRCWEIALNHHQGLSNQVETEPETPLLLIVATGPTLGINAPTHLLCVPTLPTVAAGIDSYIRYSKRDTQLLPYDPCFFDPSELQQTLVIAV